MQRYPHKSSIMSEREEQGERPQYNIQECLHIYATSACAKIVEYV